MTINRARHFRSFPATRVWAFLLTVAVCALGIGSVASAGRWAISTLDELPNPIAGEPIEVGFTIRQHGITPIDMSEGVGIRITLADGTTHYFTAAGDGVIGHYIARVKFPSAGRYSWSIRQGMFADDELGLIDVGTPTSAENTDGSLVSLRFAGLAGAMLFGLVALADVVVARRRRVFLA
ncbi:MAG: hypothetical protein AAB327_05920 [Actinomycetota bacterium]